MWINLAWGGMRVMDVAAGGPAAAAGLLPGDVLTGIDGKAVAASTLSDVRRQLKLLPVGKPATFTYLRAGMPGEARLTPALLIPD